MLTLAVLLMVLIDLVILVLYTATVEGAHIDGGFKTHRVPHKQNLYRFSGVSYINTTIVVSSIPYLLS